MKKLYAAPTMEIVKLSQDVVTTSCSGDTCQWEGPCDDD